MKGLRDPQRLGRKVALSYLKSTRIYLRREINHSEIALWNLKSSSLAVRSQPLVKILQAIFTIKNCEKKITHIHSKSPAGQSYQKMMKRS